VPALPALYGNPFAVIENVVVPAGPGDKVLARH
jgi:hypothetical protein